MNSNASVLVDLLKKKGLTLSCAESCTGGLLAKTITDIAGVSSVFWGGVVSYDNSVKQNALGVCADTLASYGAVSAPVAEQMAGGVCRLCSTNVGLSTTGIAGPGGGTFEKPVGTVYIGVCINGEVCSKRLCLSPDLSREEIRERSVAMVIEYAIEKISHRY